MLSLAAVITFSTVSRAGFARHRRSARMWPMLQKSREETPDKHEQRCETCVKPNARSHVVWATLVTRGGRATPAASRAGALRRERPAARSAAPEQARAGARRNDLTSWRTHDQPTATSTRATRP